MAPILVTLALGASVEVDVFAVRTADAGPGRALMLRCADVADSSRTRVRDARSELLDLDAGYAACVELRPGKDGGNAADYTLTAIWEVRRGSDWVEVDRFVDRPPATPLPLAFILDPDKLHGAAALAPGGWPSGEARVRVCANDNECRETLREWPFRYRPYGWEGGTGAAPAVASGSRSLFGRGPEGSGAGRDREDRDDHGLRTFPLYLAGVGAGLLVGGAQTVRWANAEEARAAAAPTEAHWERYYTAIPIYRTTGWTAAGIGGGLLVGGTLDFALRPRRGGPAVALEVGPEAAQVQVVARW